MKTFQLYLGRNIPTGGVVTEQQVATFLHDIVGPRFDGFTVQEATGYWKGELEKNVILTICCEDYDQPLVATIAELYKLTFNQDAVMMLTLPAPQFI